MAGGALSEGELTRYDVCPIELARRVRLVRVPAIPGGYGGMTLGRLVLLARDVPRDGTSPLLAHELVHVRQWAEHGVVGFALRYLAHFARGLARHRSWSAAYRHIGFEAAARAETEAWARRRPASGQGGEALP